jgi:anti-sigma factor RsiW
MTWTCEQIEARLSDYVDGLMPPAERRDFAAHTESCADCAPLLASVLGLVQNLHALEAIEPPPRLAYTILNQTLGPREQAKGFRGAFGWLNALLSVRFAYGAISVAASLVILLTASGFSFRKPKLADLSPVNLYRTADRQAHLVYARSTKFVSDLRVVYEIQSRLSKDNNELPTDPESTVPQSNPGKNPGSTDSTKPGSPKQQNRANGLSRQVEVLAAQFPPVPSVWGARLFGRSIR